VDVRIVIVADILIVFLSLGAIWLAVGNSGSIPSAYDAFDVAGMVGGYVGGQQINPPSYTQNDYNAFVQAVLAPLIVGSWELDAAMISLTVALVLACLSFVRWQLSLPAGVLEVLGSVLWSGGVSSISQEAGSRLAAW
jgi:hypothetical protein